MQAIITKYLGSRIKASCERGSITVSYPHELSGDDRHTYVADMLCKRFIAEDAKTYGTPTDNNPWGRKRVVGTIPSGDVVHVFTQ